MISLYIYILFNVGNMYSTEKINNSTGFLYDFWELENRGNLLTGSNLVYT